VIPALPPILTSKQVRASACGVGLGLGLGLGLGFRVKGKGFRVSVSGLGFRVSGFGFRVSDFGFRVHDPTPHPLTRALEVITEDCHPLPGPRCPAGCGVLGFRV